jgi:hypothetical protein
MEVVRQIRLRDPEKDTAAGTRLLRVDIETR